MNTMRITTASRRLVLAGRLSLGLGVAVVAQEVKEPKTPPPAEVEETAMPSASADRTDHWF